MPVNPNHHVPIYEQIVEHICGCVTAGLFLPGEVLPSIRVLALELIVNPNTVQRAYQELERLGLVEMRKGRGVFVAANGCTSARRQTEAAVRDRFVQGVQVARGANLADSSLETIFREALDADAGLPKKGATGGSPASARPRNEARSRNEVTSRNEANPGDQAPPDSRSKS